MKFAFLFGTILATVPVSAQTSEPSRAIAGPEFAEEQPFVRGNPQTNPRRIAQARKKQARIKAARIKHARLKHKRIKQHRIKMARRKASARR